MKIEGSVINDILDTEFILKEILYKISLISDKEIKNMRSSVNKKKDNLDSLIKEITEQRTRLTLLVNENNRLKLLSKTMKLIESLIIEGLIINKGKILGYLNNNKILETDIEEIKMLHNELESILTNVNDNKRII